MKIFHLPDLGEGLAEAEIREWYVKVGDVVTVDQPIVSMETAKAVVDVPSPYAGKIVALHGATNELIKTGAALVSYETDAAYQDKGSVVGKLEVSESKWAENEVTTEVTKTRAPTVKAMPAARVLAKEMQVDLKTVTPTGPQGLITVEDVKQLLKAAPTASGQTETLHGVRRVMAQAMSQSHHEVVPVTIFEDANISHLPKQADLTVLLLLAMIAAAKQEPALNAWFDGKTLERKQFDQVHIGLAVDGPEGLFVPVIKDAGQYSSKLLREQVDRLKQAVMQRTLPAADMQGATITLSNFGMIAGRYATPIIVPPAVSILGCGRSREEAVVVDGQIKVGRILPLSLSFDHRAVTGGEATRYLGAIIAVLQKK